MALISLRNARRPRPESRFDGLASRADNVASLVIDALRATNGADPDVVDGILAPDMVVADHRVDPPRVLGDRQTLAVVLGMPRVRPIEFRLLAVRGESLATVRATMVRPDGEIADIVAVAGCRSDGTLARLEVFELDDVAGATRCLAGHYIATLTDPQQAVVAPAAMLMGALAGHDFDSAARMLHVDFEHVDHRDGLTMTLDRAQALELFRRVLTDDEDLRDIVTEIHAVTERGLVASRTQATPETLGNTDTELVLVTTRDREVDFMEFYDRYDLDRALVRLEHLTAS